MLAIGVAFVQPILFSLFALVARERFLALPWRLLFIKRRHKHPRIPPLSNFSFCRSVFRTKNTLCQFNRFPYTLLFGAEYDQVEYQRRAGRPNMNIPGRKWQGLVTLRNAFLRLSANLTENENEDAFIHLVNQISTKLSKEIIPGELIQRVGSCFISDGE